MAAEFAEKVAHCPVIASAMTNFAT